MSGPTRTPEDLTADIQRYLNLSVADSTKQTYSTGGKSFIEFLSLYRPLHAQSLPTDEDTLIQYVAYLAKSSSIPLSRDTWQQSVIFTSATATSLTLRSSIACTLSAVALRDLKVAQSELVCQLQYPTSYFFYSLLAIRYTANYDSLMIWATMTLAFFGFMQLGELTCNSQFNSDAHLTPLDIIFHPSQSNPSHLLVKVKVS